ncbi:MAG: hypothetical protein ABI891_01560 [Acidobacteriota bacterium]
MISQRCPRCHSSRIRKGYRPTPIWSKILFRFNLLCDGCNWEFRGFAVPGTVSAKPNRKKKKREPTVKKPEYDEREIEGLVGNLGKKD